MVLFLWSIPKGKVGVFLCTFFNYTFYISYLQHPEILKMLFKIFPLPKANLNEIPLYELVNNFGIMKNVEVNMYIIIDEDMSPCIIIMKKCNVDFYSWNTQDYSLWVVNHWGLSVMSMFQVNIIITLHIFCNISSIV